jgi:O-succinylbenzoate synthase
VDRAAVAERTARALVVDADGPREARVERGRANGARRRR